MMNVKISFHGHSTYTDGLDSVKTLAQKAYESRIDFFGISDHDTVEQIAPMYEQVERLNATNGFKMIPVAASELRIWDSNIKVDTIFAKPGPIDLDFINWLNDVIKNVKSLDLKSTIV